MVATDNVVVMFTDMVGSTELSQGHAPDVAQDLLRAHFAILRQALTETGGTEVKHLGDGLMAAFQSASAAITCAVLMQQGTELDNRTRAQPIGLRIGLSGGEVLPEDGDYFGDPVVEAARLCAACEGGQILASQVVPLMSGRRNPHECRVLGRRVLKGLHESVEIVEVCWEPLADTSTVIPLPERLAARVSAPVVGREPELALLDEAFARVTSAERPELLLVAGEAGLGKTTLVAEAASRCSARGASVLFGHCEQDFARPYQLFAESLGHYVTHAPEAELVAHVADHGPELVRLVPGLRDRLAELVPSKATDEETERYLLFSAAVGLLSEASARAGVVLVFDDLQWADSASLALLRHLLTADQPMHVLVLGTYRDDELPRAPELRETLGVLRRRGPIARVELTGLDGAGIVLLMEAAAGHQLDHDGMDLARAVQRETDGNPFFVTEILRFLAETGAIGRDDTGRWTASGSLDVRALPDSVREVIGGRAARLGSTAERALSVAAVIGRDFDLELLARATGATHDDVLDLLDDAAAAALVREVADGTGHYRFSHSLVQHTMYENLGPTRRARAHQQVAVALEELCAGEPGPRVGELARHWVNATQPIDLTKAIRYSRLAGAAALRALAPGDAVRYFSQAIDLDARRDASDPVLSIDLAIGLGTAQRQVGDPSFRDTLLDAARRADEAGESARLVAAVLANNRGFYSAVGATDADKVALLEKALATLPADDCDRALVLATLCSERAHGSALEHRRALADEAVTIAQSCGDDATIVRVLNHLGVPLQVPHLLELALVRTIDALARAERLGDPALLYWAAMWRAETAARAGDMEEMERCLKIHAETTRQLDQPIFRWGCTFAQGLRALIAGDTDAAEQLATEALAIGTESGQPDAGTIFGAQLMIVHGQRGTMSELIPLVEEMATTTPDISPWLFGSLLAKAHAEADRNEEAAGYLDRFAAADFDLPFDQVWLTGMVDYAEAAIECRSRRHAGPLYDRLRPFATQLPATGASALPPVSSYLGGLATVLGRYDEAEAHLAESAAMSRRMGAKFFAARTDLLSGRLYAVREEPGDADRARERLTAATDAAAQHGYRGVERRATRSLERLAV
jgi:class 3 adenylate cyclase